MNTLELHRFDQHVVDAFKANWSVFADFGDVIARLVNVRIAEHQQRARSWIVNQLEGRFENDHAGAFGSNQRARDVESIFGKQFVQIISGNTTRNFWKMLPDQLGVFVAKSEKFCIGLRAPVVARTDLRKLSIVRFSDAHDGAVVEE